MEKKIKKLQVLNHKAIVNTHCSSTITRTVPLPGLFQSAWILFSLPFPRMGWRRRLRSPIRLLYLTSTSWSNVTKVKNLIPPLHSSDISARLLGKMFTDVLSKQTMYEQPVIYYSQTVQHYTTRLAIKAQCGSEGSWSSCCSLGTPRLLVGFCQ